MSVARDRNTAETRRDRSTRATPASYVGYAGELVEVMIEEVDLSGDVPVHGGSVCVMGRKQAAWLADIVEPNGEQLETGRVVIVRILPISRRSVVVGTGGSGGSATSLPAHGHTSETGDGGPIGILG